MSDLISRSALLEKIQFRIPNDRVLTDIVDSCVKITRRIIEEAPAVDAVPVVHGRWIHTKIEDSDWGGTFNSWKCSVCGYYAGRNPTGTNYCPNCGAKMRGADE